jgi:hypothetical protein
MRTINETGGPCPSLVSPSRVVWVHKKKEGEEGVRRLASWATGQLSEGSLEKNAST